MFEATIIFSLLLFGALIFWMGYRIGKEAGYAQGRIYQSKRSMNILKNSVS